MVFYMRYKKEKIKSEKCIGCGVSFENWVSSKVDNHLGVCDKIYLVDGIYFKRS